MGGAGRRARRRAARPRRTGLLPPPPAHGAALPPAPAERARGADPDREVDQRLERLDAAVRRADLLDRGRAGRQGDARRGALAARLPLARGAPRGRRRGHARAASPACARAHSSSTRCSSTRRPTTACATTDHWLAARNLGERGERRVGRGAGRGRHGPLRAGAPLVPAEGEAARHRPPRRLRPHGAARHRRGGASSGRPPASWCSTPTARSRRHSARSRSASSPSAGSTPRPAHGKQGGGFCAYTVPSVHPYVLLNFTGPPPRRAGPRARARARRARRARRAAGHLPPVRRR